MKTGIFFASALIATLLPALSQARSTVWIPSRNERCEATCRAEDMRPVRSGRYMNGNPFSICRADQNGEGMRPGYNLAPDWSRVCVVPWGGKEVSSTRYDCLCE
jgi:hypothetical protein